MFLKSILTVALVFAAMLFVGCSNVIKDIPAGYVGKKLMPTGWDKTILEAGQVDLGDQNSNGTYTKLVLLEATSISIKESFAPQGEEDHRIIIGKTPVAVDVYIRLMIPTDIQRRNAIFSQITPKRLDDYVSSISIGQIYNQFAKVDIRSGVRAILQKQDSVDYILKHMDKFSTDLGAMAIKRFQDNGVPLDVQNVQLSNVKVDQTVWAAENQKAAALSQVEAINKIGEALRKNPEYIAFRKYDTYEKIKDKIGSFNIYEGFPATGVIGK